MRKYRQRALKAWVSKTTPMPQRFWNMVKRGFEEDCWPYLGWTRGAYGGFHLEGKDYVAHRVAWELYNGSIPQGLFVLHKCDNPICCNPHHLFLGTQKTNMEDASKKGRMGTMWGDACPYSKITNAQAAWIRKTYKHQYGERKKLAKRFGVDPGTISEIVSGRTFKHI